MMKGKANNKFSNLPAGWEVKKLKDVFYINELALPANTPSDFQFRYIPIEKVSTNHIDYENCEQFEFQDAPGRARRIIRQNDILISGVRPNLKAFAIFKKPDDKNWICSTGFFVLTAKQPEDNLISYYELLSEICGSQFYSLVVGTNYPAIGDSDIRNIRLMLPSSKEEKTAVANILSKVDEAIVSVQNSIATAERLKKSLMQNLLTGRMKPDGTLRKEDEFYLDEKFGRVPVGWMIRKGIEITCKITKGQSPKWQGFEYQNEGILFVTSENIRDGYIDVSEPKYLPLEFNNKIKNSQLAKGDVLINIVGASIGRCALFDFDVECANTNQAVCIFRPNEENDSAFLSYYLQDDTTQKRLFRTQVETARANLSLGDFRKFKFVIPQKDEQIEIAAKINQFNEIIIDKVNKIAVLERLKKSLMQNLLTGRVKTKKSHYEN